jgi:transcription elongation GreA/GreB family factor
MNKRRIIEHIVEKLAEELKGIEAAVDSAREAATDTEAKPENEYDTRAIEAGYLAAGQAKRADELRAQLLMYKHFPLRDLDPKSEACAGALVELEINESRAFYFVAPAGGGIVTAVDGKPVHVITPMSPIGDALMGRKAGQDFDVEFRDNVRTYKVISVK